MGRDELKKTKNYFGDLIYCVRFHVYPDTKIVKTKGRNSILISLSNGDGWLLQSSTNKFEIERYRQIPFEVDSLGINLNSGFVLCDK